ncbi:S41 family peptidase [Trebonia sp.]|uniref:S41 family peptidase n=1 Tax=Trebonia sp. TaxID=2767075 RepID=UPI003BAFAD0C
MEQGEREEFNRVVDHEVKGHFPAGAVRRAVLLRHGDEQGIEAGYLLLRVFVEVPDEQGLAVWRDTHRAEVDGLRRDLSRRLPSARLLELTFDEPGAPRISVPDDGSLTTERLSGREIVTKALALVRANYVFPELAEQAATAIEARLAAGEYDQLDEITLTELVTRHLQEATGDRHLAVMLGDVPPPNPRPGPRPWEPKDYEARQLARRQRFRWDNFGIRRVERLDGNVGYLDLRRMPDPANAGPAIAAAMELVAGTYALIIDMRRNGGGSPEGVVFWCSHLVDEQPTHFTDIVYADTGETRQFWSLPYVPGSRYLDRPVYVLTSRRTFSAGEDLCYALQVLGRAELIGETTGGGAHPTRVYPVSTAVCIGIPFARSVNPVTGADWPPATGVVPDIAVPEAEACDLAYARALQYVLALADVPPPIMDEARDALAVLPASATGLRCPER